MRPTDHALTLWCGRRLGVPVETVLFEVSQLSRVLGVRLVDRREVVIKARPWQDRVLACWAVQRSLADRGFPCPHCLLDPEDLGGYVVTAEEYRPGGEQLTARADSAELVAALLARLVGQTPHLTGLEALIGASPPWVGWDHPGAELWPVRDTPGPRWSKEPDPPGSTRSPPPSARGSERQLCLSFSATGTGSRTTSGGPVAVPTSSMTGKGSSSNPSRPSSARPSPCGPRDSTGARPPPSGRAPLSSRPTSQRRASPGMPRHSSSRGPPDCGYGRSTPRKTLPTAVGNSLTSSRPRSTNDASSPGFDRHGPCCAPRVVLRPSHCRPASRHLGRIPSRGTPGLRRRGDPHGA
jgi:hypothetical protein